MHDIRATYKYWCALNVSSDLIGRSHCRFTYFDTDIACIVMILPLFMVWGLQLRTTQKLVLAGVFSLAFVVAIFDILRTVNSLQSGTFSGVALWSSLEVTIAVIVASLPLYRALLTSKGRELLASRVSMSRYLSTRSGSTAIERKGSDDTISEPINPSVKTFREDLETQNFTHSRGGSHVQQT